MDTFTTIWNRLLARAPDIMPGLAQQFVSDSFNQLVERRDWSWRQKHSAFYPSIYYNTGTVAVTPGSAVVTGTGTVFTPQMTGLQITIGGTPAIYGTYTVTYIGPTSLMLDQPWIGPALTTSGFQIFQCYFTVPPDFQSFYTLTNPTTNQRLWHNCTQAQFDSCDPQRTNFGPSFGAAFYDYTQNFSGTVAATQQAHGSGPVPVSTTTYGYSFPANSVYSVEITTGGVPGGALDFKWKQDGGAYTTGVAVPDTGAIDLSNGVQIYFPTATYVAGDVFVIVATAQGTAAQLRYELWPRPVNSPYLYNYLYMVKLPDLSDAQPQLPSFVARRGDVVLEMSLQKAASWPGTSSSRNGYYDLNLAQQHRVSGETMIYELEKKDDETAMKDLVYQSMDWAPAPWMDGSYLQSHAWPVAAW